MRGAVAATVAASTVVVSIVIAYNHCTHIIKMNVSNDNENASAMLDELDATEIENNDPFVMFDSMGPSLVTSHIPTPTLALALPIIPVRGSPTAQAKTEFHNSRVRFHAILRAPKPGSRHRMPLLGPQTHLTHNCWVAFHKYVKMFTGWKLSRRVVPNRCVANNKRKLYCIDAVYTHYKPQPLVATPASSGGKNHIWSVASAGNFQGEQPAVATAASTARATATATMDGVLVDSTNFAPNINTVERKLPAQTMTVVTPDAPPVAPTAAAAVAISSTAGMNTNQSPTPTATDTTTTGHVFRYGDLVTFPLLHITPPTTLKAIVVQVHPANDDCAGKDKDEDGDGNGKDTQLVTVSTGPGERFTVPIHHLVLIQPIASML
jgi:hypothetical protein